MQETIKIVVADDHPIVREGLVMILNLQDDFEVIGEAQNGEEALAKVASLVPDILFLDLGMPKMDGVQTIQAMQAKGLSTQVIVFTAFDTDERILGAIRAGAKGYLLKGVAKEDIFNAVRVVHAGQSLLQPEIASKLVKHMSNPIGKLSARELEVLAILAKGAKNSEIAKELFIAERTVKFHVSSILSKLGAKNRTEAVQVAVKRGLIDLGNG
ncbi:MAG: response regulator transcription factor [Aureispira sp.]|nr:response regulator transcription factor [Aureispira sp.]